MDGRWIKFMKGLCWIHTVLDEFLDYAFIKETHNKSDVRVKSVIAFIGEKRGYVELSNICWIQRY